MLPRTAGKMGAAILLLAVDIKGAIYACKFPRQSLRHKNSDFPDQRAGLPTCSGQTDHAELRAITEKVQNGSTPCLGFPSCTNRSPTVPGLFHYEVR